MRTAYPGKSRRKQIAEAWKALEDDELTIEVGDITFELQVSDGTNVSADTVTITVNAVDPDIGARGCQQAWLGAVVLVLDLVDWVC